MRIDLNAGIVLPESQPDGRTEKGARASDGMTASSESGFRVRQNSVTALAASALQAPEIRSQKVEELKSRVAAGTYQVSPQQIAGALLEHMRAAG